MIWILDTDHVSLFQQRHPLVSKRVSEAKPEELAITLITVQKQMRGWLNTIQRESESERLIWAYTGLSDAVRFFSGINLLNFSQAAYTCYRELKRQRIRVGTQDLRIASIVLSVKGILVTRNQRDFERVSGLSLADWTIDQSQLG